MISGIITFFKALAALRWAAGCLSWVPGLGAFAGPVSAVLGFLMAVWKWFWEGVVVIFTHPVTLVTVGFLAFSSFLGGAKFGIWWDGSRAVYERLAADKRVKDIETAHNDAVAKAVKDAQDAADALKAANTPEEIKAACKASKACRSNGKI